MKKPFTVKCQEEGRGKWSRKSFSTLAEAETYIKDRWMGPEYMDGTDGFHTDYCLYTLVGFTLKDIGTVRFNMEWCCREFEFNSDKKPPVWKCKDDSCDAAHCPRCGGHKLNFYAEGLCSECQQSDQL